MFTETSKKEEKLRKLNLLLNYIKIYKPIKVTNFIKSGKMAKKCIYCKCELSDKSVIDFCDRCGRSVFGEPMLKAIISNMEKADKRGDLMQGE